MPSLSGMVSGTLRGTWWEVLQEFLGVSHNDDGTISDEALEGTTLAIAVDDHIANVSNPHTVTATQVGLGNVNNTSDANKPVSTATQTALDLKADEADLDALSDTVTTQGTTLATKADQADLDATDTVVGGHTTTLSTHTTQIAYTNPGAAATDDSYAANISGINVWRKIRRKKTGDFGAIGDGTSHPLSEEYGTLGAAQAVYPHVTALSETIDWAALQLCINDGVSGSQATHRIEIENQHLVINKKLSVTYRHGFELEGDGAAIANIIQEADNTPIIEWAANDFGHHFALGGTALTYANQQAPADTAATAILVTSAVNSQPNSLQFDELYVDGAYDGFKATNTGGGGETTVPFIVNWRHSRMERISGHAMYVNQPAGKPQWVIDDFWLSPATGGNAPAYDAEAAFFLTGVNLDMRNVTVDAWPGRVGHFSGHNNPVRFTNVQFGESSTYDQFATYILMYVANGGGVVNGGAFGGTVATGGSNVYCYSFDGNGGVPAEMDGFQMSGVLTSGNLYPLRLFGGVVGKINSTGGTKGTHYTDLLNPASGERDDLKEVNGVPWIDPTLKSTDYTVVMTDRFLTVDASGGARTITLPPAVAAPGQTLTVKRINATNNVIVDGNSSETIDGAATKTITTQYGFLTIVCDGAAWHIVASGGTIT